MFEALDQLAWSQNPRASELFQQCREELESFTHLQLPLSNAYDRADLLCDLKETYTSLLEEEGVPPALKELLAECWDTPYIQLRTKLAHLAQWLAQQPQAGLKCLDKIHFVGKSLLGQLNERCGALLTAKEPTSTPSQIQSNCVICLPYSSPGTRSGITTICDSHCWSSATGMDFFAKKLPRIVRLCSTTFDSATAKNCSPNSWKISLYGVPVTHSGPIMADRWKN